MTRGPRGIVGIVLAVGMLAACSAPPAPDAWLLTPLRHDNRLDGADSPWHTDVTFPMRLTSDTAGGLWGHSAGSWLHLDADGETLRRFNLLDGEAPLELRGIAALTPDVLVVSAPAADASGAVHEFDTATGSWRVLHRADGILGDLAVHDGAVYVVQFATGDGEFTVRRLQLDAPDVLVDATPPLPWPPAVGSTLHGTVAIDVAPDGAIHVATQAERIVVGVDGTILDRAPHDVTRPDVAVGPDGVAAWVTTAGGEVAPTHVTAGSPEARAVLAPTSCADSRVLVGRGVDGVPLALGCVAGLAWVGPATVVASLGGEGGAVLTRLDGPTG